MSLLLVTPTYLRVSFCVDHPASPHPPLQAVREMLLRLRSSLSLPLSLHRQEKPSLVYLLHLGLHDVNATVRILRSQIPAG